MDFHKIILPKPPSLNAIYGYTSMGGFARSYITPRGKTWFEEAIHILSDMHNEELIPTGVEDILEIEVNLFTRREQDVDNILKPTLDVLGSVCVDCFTKKSTRKSCKCGKNNSVIIDDKIIKKLFVEKHKIKSPEPERVEIGINIIK